MTTCYCRTLLAILVIIFAWVYTEYNVIILSVIGLLLLVSSIKPNICCCCGKKEEKKEPIKKVKRR